MCFLNSLGQYAIMNLLLKNNADFSLVNKNYETAMTLAVANGD